MTKKEAMRQAHQMQTLQSLGFTESEAQALRRISMTLHRWHEMECGIDNGRIERDEQTGKAYWLNSMTMRRFPIADRETGALKRLKAIIAARNLRHETATKEIISAGDAINITRKGMSAYIQTDPRGAALYIIRPGDVPEGKEVERYYSRGTCVY